MLVCIDGCDGSGKDTIANAVAKAIGADRMNFPNDAGVTGPMIRAYLRKRWHVQEDFQDALHNPWLSALAFQSLMVANRMEVMSRLSRAQREHESPRDSLVLARYWQSGWVYGQLDGLDPRWLLDVHRSMVMAQYNFLLDVEPEVALERRAKRDGALPAERYEGKLEMLSRTVALYRELWGSTCTDYMGDCWHVLDASKPVDQLVSTVLDALKRPL